MSLKQKALGGFFWGSLNNLSIQVVQFIVGLILARLLEPEDFGLVGMLTVFISLSASLTDGGFTAALIRKKDCSEEDYSTVFIFNFLVSIALYLILYLAADSIAIFFEKPELSLMLKVLAIKIVLDALSITQIAMVTRELNFKFQAKISLFAAFSSGILGVVCAIQGMGTWSLIVQVISFALINSVLFYYFTAWRPTLVFDKLAFREMFGFGSKLLGSSLLGKFFNEISAILIGKYLSFSDLGFYTRANTFKNLPSQTINTILTKVTYPLLSKFSDDLQKLKQNYKKIIMVTTFISFVIMGLMAATADNFIIILIGVKWKESIVLLQLLTIVGMLYPLQALNLNILNVLGKSGIHLKLTLFKNIISLPILIISLFFGLKAVVLGMVVIAFIHFYMNSKVSGKFISYGMYEQLKDIFFQSVIILSICIIVYSINIFNFNHYVTLAIQLIVFAILLVLSGELFKMYSYVELKAAVMSLIKNSKI
jgi:O-antigen/teichoic acid export membrane protein